MEAQAKKSSTGKILLVILFIVLTLSAVGYGIYTLVYQFNNQDVADYIREEVEEYPFDTQLATYKIIKDSVNDILADKELTAKVLADAKENGTPREMELVHAAILRAKSFNYIA